LQEADSGPDGTFDDTIDNLFTGASRTENTSTPLTEAETDDKLSGETSNADWDAVRFAVVHQVTGNPERVFFDTLDGVSPAKELHNAHNAVMTAAPFTPGGIFQNDPVPESSPLLGANLSLTRYILYGGYFRRTTEPTRSSRAASEIPGAGSITDSRMTRVRNLLTDTKIDARTLLVEYIHQLVQDQNEEFGNEGDYIGFPKRSVVEQYAQLRALARANALDTTQTISLTQTGMPKSHTDRSTRLEEFIESHDALAGDAETAVFTLGGLVGRISAFQTYENVSATLIRRYPVDYLTKQTIKEVTKEVLQMNSSYAEAEDSRSYRTNSRYTDRLVDTMLAADPQSWSLTGAELQWLYSLGIAYGLSDSTEQPDEQETTKEATT